MPKCLRERFVQYVNGFSWSLCLHALSGMYVGIVLYACLCFACMYVNVNACVYVCTFVHFCPCSFIFVHACMYV